MAFSISIGKNILEPKDKPWKDKIYSIGSRMILFSIRNIIPKISVGDLKKIEEIYKKYLGPGYVIDYNKKFGSILCNHNNNFYNKLNDFD